MPFSLLYDQRRTCFFRIDVYNVLISLDFYRQSLLVILTVLRMSEWCEQKWSVVNPGTVSVLGCSLNNDIWKAELPSISLNGHGSSDKLKYLGVSCRWQLNISGSVLQPMKWFRRPSSKILPSGWSIATNHVLRVQLRTQMLLTVSKLTLTYHV